MGSGYWVLGLSLCRSARSLCFCFISMSSGGWIQRSGFTAPDGINSIISTSGSLRMDPVPSCALMYLVTRRAVSKICDHTRVLCRLPYSGEDAHPQKRQCGSVKSAGLLSSGRATPSIMLHLLQNGMPWCGIKSLGCGLAIEACSITSSSSAELRGSNLHRGLAVRNSRFAARV